MLPSKSEAIRILVAGPSKAANQKIADNILTSEMIEDASSDVRKIIIICVCRRVCAIVH